MALTIEARESRIFETRETFQESHSYSLGECASFMLVTFSHWGRRCKLPSPKTTPIKNCSSLENMTKVVVAPSQDFAWAWLRIAQTAYHTRCTVGGIPWIHAVFTGSSHFQGAHVYAGCGRYSSAPSSLGKSFSWSSISWRGGLSLHPIRVPGANGVLQVKRHPPPSLCTFQPRLVGFAQDYPRLYVRASLNSPSFHPPVTWWGDND